VGELLEQLLAGGAGCGAQGLADDAAGEALDEGGVLVEGERARAVVARGDDFALKAPQSVDGAGIFGWSGIRED
jgi:hypothetical protein